MTTTQPDTRKVALITGCSSGSLGAALALSLQKANYRVIATARNTSKLTETRAAGIEDLQLDVTSQSSITACAQSLTTLTNGHLDLLINNAGQTLAMPVLDIDLDQARQVYELNVFSLISVTRAFLPCLLQTPNAKVANNISIAAHVGLPIVGTYSSSKAAANMLTETLRLELAPFGIRVIALITGAVRSNFFKSRSADTTVREPASQQQPTNPLPLDSIFRALPNGLAMMNDPEAVAMGEDAMDAHVWADQVVGDLEKQSPPHQIWRGSHVNKARVGCHLPIGMFDRQMCQAAGMEGLEEAVRRGRKET